MTDTEQRLAEIEARVEAATDEWFVSEAVTEVWSTDGETLANMAYANREIDAEFAAHARTDLPNLLAVVKGVLGLADEANRSGIRVVHVDRLRAVIREGLGR